MKLGSVIVIGGSTPEIRSHGITFLQQRLSIEIHVIQGTCPAVHRDAHPVGRHRVASPHGIHLDGILHEALLGRSGCKNIICRWELVVLQGELLTGHGISCLQERLPMNQLVLHVDENLAVGVILQQVQHPAGNGEEPQIHPFRLLRSNACQFRNLCRQESLAILQNGHHGLQVTHIAEEVFVVNIYRTIVHVEIIDPNALIVVANLVGMRGKATVRSNDTIAVEVMVRGRITTLVTTIHPYLVACHLAYSTNALIDEVPDEASLILWILANQIPILLETSNGVTHCMSILALDKRTGIVALCIFLAIIVIVVHGTEDIGLAILSTLFILHGATAVDNLHGIIGSLEVITIATLVTQRPEDDTGMILLNQHIILVALHDGLLVSDILSQATIAVAHSMTLEVCLSHQIDTILVTKVIPAGIIRVMTGADSIDVEFLHHLNILNHAAQGNHISSIRIQLVAVCTLEEHSLAVDQHLAILDLHLAETHLLGNHLTDTTLVRQRGVERIKIGNLCTPFLGIVNLHLHGGIAAFFQDSRLGSHLTPIGILKGEGD